MRKAFLLIVCVCVAMITVTTGCSNKKVEGADSAKTDSTAEEEADTIDSVDSATGVIAATPMPKAADQLFDDFFFNFIANKKLQMNRIKFPLPIVNGTKTTELSRKKWKMDYFFRKQGYYTLIFDNARQMNLVKDTTISHVVIEKIFSHKNLIQQYLFNKIKGKWMLTSMNYMSLAQNKNADFLKFYNKFATDTAFQVRSMAREVQFSAPDPNDDFAQISGVMMPQQWPDFKPGLIPNGTLYNIIYGQKYTDAGRRLFVIRGIANGLEIELSFRKVGGQWKLVKFNS